MPPDFQATSDPEFTSGPSSGYECQETPRCRNLNLDRDTQWERTQRQTRHRAGHVCDTASLIRETDERLFWRECLALIQQRLNFNDAFRIGRRLALHGKGHGATTFQH